MARQMQFIQLTNEERSSLKTLFRSGKGKNRQLTRARIFDLLDRQVPPALIAQTLSCGIATVYNIKRRTSPLIVKGFPVFIIVAC